MNRFSKSILGVTLLEIMLVLAIAAMIVVMSIRYYQSASSNEQANVALSEIQGIMAAMDNLGMATGYSSVAASDLSSVVGSNNMISPTNSAIVMSGATASTYNLTVPLNTTICPNVLAKLGGNAKITSPTCSSGTLTFTYDSTQ